jgi:hypothetical protein
MPVEEEFFNTLLRDISAEKCVLVIGPDVIDYDGKTFFEAMCNNLAQNEKYRDLVDLVPQHIFMNDEMFQLKPGAKEISFFRFMESFYAEQNSVNDVLKKIAKIKFSLIISLFPDKRIAHIFDELHMPYQFGYYPRESSPASVNQPSADCPLIYNLFGNYEERDYIFTFDHLFTFLSGIMGKRELPQVLLAELKKASTFLFLGVQFEKWYVQLLLRILVSSAENNEKLSMLKDMKTTDIRTFVSRRLDLNFLETEPSDFLNQLYTHCEGADLLKLDKPKSKAKVFISYSHADAEFAQKLKHSFEEYQVEYLLDERDMPGGEKIKDFVSLVKEVDCVLSIVSEHSLLSPWVSQETQLTLENPDIFFLPCNIDNSFLDDEGVLTEKVKVRVTERISEINQQIEKRGLNAIDDLTDERKRLSEFWNNFPNNLKEIKARKCLDITPEHYDKNIPLVIETIMGHTRKRN